MIRIRDLHKRFGSTCVLSGVDLHVQTGETHVIIGRSGEGKSVLLKHICALLPFDQGEILVDGSPVEMSDPVSVKHVRSRVSMVFQNSALFDSMTVRENVGFYLDERREKSPEEIDAIVENLLEEVNLTGTERLVPSELSGGMRKRIGLARALTMRPCILLYDEPTTGLDPVTTDVINNLIIQTKMRHRVTSIVVSHDMKSAFRIGDRISMLYRGRMIFTGTPEEMETTQNRIVRQFVEGLAVGPITEDDERGLAAECEGAGDRARKLEGASR